MTPNERHVLLLCGVTHFFAHFFMLLFPSLSLWIHEDLGLSMAATLNLGFLMYLLFGFMAVPMGYLGDRWSNRRMLVAMMLGIGAGCALCAAAPGPRALAAGLAVIGFFAAVYHPVGMAMISHCCANRGRALGINGVWGNLGIGLAPIMAGIAGYVAGWRWTFAVYGAATALLGLLLLRIRVDETRLDRTGMAGHAREGQGMTFYFILMLVCMTLLGLCYRGTVVSIPAHFEARMEMLTGLFIVEGRVGNRKLGTALLVSAMYLFGAVGQVAGGRLADRWDLRKGYLLFHACSIPCMLGIAAFAEAPLLAASLGYVFFSLGMQPIENSLVARLTPPHLRSLGYGLKFILVLGFSAFAVKGVKWLMEDGRGATVDLVQAGLITAVVLIIAVIAIHSRRQTWMNAPPSGAKNR